MTEFVVVLCTAPPGGADKIAGALVEEGLAACVNVSTVRSYFIWRGKPSNEREELMMIKTEQRLADKVMARIKELHSYELPEIIALPIIAGDEGYLQWISRSVGGL
jgi:periplasmic divalent cation tolerance protein